MQSSIEIENKIKSLKPILASQFAVNKIGYFGSFARNEQKENSDIDILVELQNPLGWAFFDLKDFLEKELNTKVDLVTEAALKNKSEI